MTRTTTRPTRPGTATRASGRRSWSWPRAPPTSARPCGSRATRSSGSAVMATGHGTAPPCDGGLLINTSRMTGVHIDPAARTARVEAGARWADVVPAAAAHGLAGLPGSSSQVGVVGYTMGGGFGWLGRKYGLASHSIRDAEVVTADGELVRASAHENADLFWGLAGGGGNFGIVTSLRFALHPVGDVYGGNLFYPVARAREVLEFYAAWNRTPPRRDGVGGDVPLLPAAADGPREPPRSDVHRGARLLLRRRPRGGPEVDRARARGARGARRRHLRDHARRADGHDQHGPDQPDRLLLRIPSCCPTSRRRSSRRWSSWAPTHP